jgi:hypothetical protein
MEEIMSLQPGIPPVPGVGQAEKEYEQEADEARVTGVRDEDGEYVGRADREADVARATDRRSDDTEGQALNEDALETFLAHQRDE